MNKSLSRFGGMRLLLNRMLNKGRISNKLLLCSVITGVITGFVCSLFEIIPQWVNEFRLNYLHSLNAPYWVVLVVAFVISATLGGIAVYYTRKYAPEAGGSGIPEIEGALINLRPVRFWRVLPVKFLGGMLALSSGMILGREGPSIQIGGNLGAWVSHTLHLDNNEFHILLAAGAASGLASAFNAPLAGILFVLEELRPQFRFNFASVQAVTVSVIISTITRDNFSGVAPVFSLPNFAMVDLHDLFIFLGFGIFIGVLGVFFNKAVGVMQDIYESCHGGKIQRAVPIIAIVAGIFGIISVLNPHLSGSGMQYIPSWIVTNLSIGMLLIIFAVRLLGTLLCFCSGIPGGIFAPSLSLGTIVGSICGMVLVRYGITNYDPGIMAIVGMGAFFAASVRAPVTGIILVCEMTNNFQFLLPMMVTVATATYVAGALNASPLYTQILERTLRMSGNKQILDEYEIFKNSSSRSD
jgi:chloride channel protein, CIC family